MKLRGANNYSIGLDLGTNSVGWAVADEERELLKFKGKPTWGSRLFDEGETAADTRVKRGQRRRYNRRRQRLNLLQGFFLDEIEKVDPEFFIRLNQSRLLKEDRAEGHTEYRWPLFNDGDFTERDYYAKFPTIYHLRKYLTETSEKVDIRLIYLAFHNIVKTRGNFLYQDQPNLTAKNANIEQSVRNFVTALVEWCEEREEGNPFSCDEGEAPKKIQSILEDPSISKRGERRDKLAEVFWFKTPEGKNDKAKGKQFANATMGYKADFKKILEEEDASSFALSDDEKVDEFEGSICPDEFAEVFKSLRGLYSAFILSGILKNADGGTISVCKCAEYEQYGKDLATLKALVREYAPSKYDEFFRGPFYENTHEYDVSKARGYTKYDLGPKKSGYLGGTNYDYDAFKKDVCKLFEGTDALNDARYGDMLARFENQTFLRRLKTSDNGSIPYQLHLEEMAAIISRQAAHYPFLAEHGEKIKSLVSFRIPYYVGPLTTKNARRGANGEMRFAWSVRVEGREDERVFPWNWDEVIDKDKSAERFIQRMTGTCTYLQGEPVLPKCSLLYEEFCVLNELNGVRWSQDGDREYRFDYGDRHDIMEEFFKRRGSVSHDQLSRWLEKRGFRNVRISGTQDEKKFVSKLGSYQFFKKLLDASDGLSESQEAMAEELILWSTLFEDRGILKEKIKKKYGELLSDEQIGKVCRKRFAGWGRLSKEFLCGLKAQTDDGPKSIMDILREGDPNNTRHPGRAMNLMETLHDDTLGFEGVIEKRNKEYAQEHNGLAVEDMPGSPALRRSVNQALRIVEEIVGIAGSEPTAIYVETTREEDERNKGRRTVQRYQRIKDALEPFKKEDPDLWDELRQKDKGDFANKRLALYFIQRGRCMYTGEPLNIGELSSYEIDHILPRSLVKDDSIENLALVTHAANQRKTDKLTLEPSTINKMRSTWKSLLEAGLIGKKKYENLIRTDFSEGQIKGFIARQLVETSQVIKFVQQMLAERYPSTKIVPVKASTSAGLKEALGVVKCREANDYHHAHDAYIACCIGSFISNYYGDILDNPIRTAHIVKGMLKEQKEGLKKGRMLGSSGFFTNRFMSERVNEGTGELWCPEDEAAKIRRTLDFKSCFITRMSFESTGAFWDQTIYSPRHMKGTGIPVKAGLDPMKYGGYSREQFAYFFVYHAKGKKGKDEFVFASVPVSVAPCIKKCPEVLEQRAEAHANEAGKEFIRVVKRKILKNQVIECNNSMLLIKGFGEVRNAREIAFNQSETRVLRCVLDGKPCDEADSLFELICKKACALAPRSAQTLGLSNMELRDRFSRLGSDEKAQVIKELLANLNGAKNKINLKPIGKGGTVGAINFSFNKELKEGLVFVDVSVTGMFERRYRLEF